MVTIYKYQFEIKDEVVINMPAHSVVLCVGAQNNTPTMWVKVDTEFPTEAREFRIYGTGHKLDDNNYLRKYKGTIQLDGFVWHVFE